MKRYGRNQKRRDRERIKELERQLQEQPRRSLQMQPFMSPWKIGDHGCLNLDNWLHALLRTEITEVVDKGFAHRTVALTFLLTDDTKKILMGLNRDEAQFNGVKYRVKEVHTNRAFMQQSFRIHLEAIYG